MAFNNLLSSLFNNVVSYLFVFVINFNIGFWMTKFLSLNEKPQQFKDREFIWQKKNYYGRWFL